MDAKEFWRNEKVAFLALTSLKGIGFWTLHKIYEQGIGYKEALRNPEKHGICKYFKPESNGSAPEEIWNRGLDIARELALNNIRIYFRNEQDFPRKLKDLSDPPNWIFIQGSIHNLDMPAIAIVGSRNISDDGVFLTRLAAATISELNCVTVSGLALGIDQLCHTESIRYEIPTIAVLGTGMLNNYPKGSDELRKEIIKAGGTVITEYLPMQSYSAENFVRRNRIQAALCDVLIPAEWKIKSGTAHTVRFAHKQNKLIINLFLPKSEHSKPEIEFSKEEYGAISFCVPHQTTNLIDAIKKQITTSQTENKEPTDKTKKETVQLNLI